MDDHYLFGGLSAFNFSDRIQFVGSFGITKKGQMDPSLTFDINWTEGYAIIYENSIFEREVIISRIMV